MIKLLGLLLILIGLTFLVIGIVRAYRYIRADKAKANRRFFVATFYVFGNLLLGTSEWIVWFVVLLIAIGILLLFY